MSGKSIDLDKLRVALRHLTRGDLLIIADRAAGLVPRAKLRALMGDRVRLEEVAKAKAGSYPLFDEVRKFHAAGIRGDYYEAFDVNSKNFMQKSAGTDAFIADFDRLMTKCTRGSVRPPRGPVREAFDLLFDLLRRLDTSPDDVIFFADEGGSWQVGVDWRAVLPAYFRSLADGTVEEEYVHAVDRVITDFVEQDRPRYLAAARRFADAEQKAALRGLAKVGRRR